MRPSRAAPALLLALLLSGSAPVLAGPKVVLPVPVKTLKPDYPEKEWKEKVTGVVVIDILIDEKGNVADTNVVASPGEAFSKAADACVRKWKFRPGTSDGVASAFRQTVTINFNVTHAKPTPKK